VGGEWLNRWERDKEDRMDRDEWYAKKALGHEGDAQTMKHQDLLDLMPDPSDEELGELGDSGFVEDLLVDLDREDRHDDS
jgi:hypothetical protein